VGVVGRKARKDSAHTDRLTCAWAQQPCTSPGDHRPSHMACCPRAPSALLCPAPGRVGLACERRKGSKQPVPLHRPWTGSSWAQGCGQTQGVVCPGGCQEVQEPAYAHSSAAWGAAANPAQQRLRIQATQLLTCSCRGSSRPRCPHHTRLGSALPSTLPPACAQAAQRTGHSEHAHNCTAGQAHQPVEVGAICCYVAGRLRPSLSLAI
jgi:hypothetical protein